MKTCNKCNETKTLEEFRFLRMNKDGTELRRARCIECENQLTLERYHAMPKQDKRVRQQKNRATLGADYFKEWKLDKKYGLTLDRFCGMLWEQDNKCYICHKDIAGKGVKVDHDHSTGRVRRLLCHNCNTTLGLMNENPDLLRKCADYLETE